jgi:hypothetical protein
MRLLVAVATIGILMIAGCGKSDWGYLNGTVLLNGQPVGPGMISLQAADGLRVGATAYFGADGKYKVISSGRKDGAHVGEYLVAIQGGENLDEENSGPRPKSNIPARYASSTTSKLKVTIEPGTKTFDFNLKP